MPATFSSEQIISTLADTARSNRSRNCPLPRIPFARQIPASLRMKFQLLEPPLLSLEFTAAMA
ncbi:MAG: hypothetical protein ACOVNL_09010 [Prochlorococcaceae cyanobacterium]|jgi:hypothetical protein